LELVILTFSCYLSIDNGNCIENNKLKELEDMIETVKEEDKKKTEEA